MIQKPMSLVRRDYIQSIVELTNKTELPLFVKVDILDRVLNEMRSLVSDEIKRDEATYRAALQKESEETAEPTDNDKE